MKITRKTVIIAEVVCMKCKATITVRTVDDGEKGRGEIRLIVDKMAAKGWRHGHKGDLCPKCVEPEPQPRASKVDLAEARKLHAEGWTLAELGERYGVTRARMSQVLKD